MQGKILILDAIATNRIVLKVKLASAFYQVLQAANLTEAVTLAQDHVPDLILTGLTLPEGTALDLCTALRASPRTEHIPIMAIGSRAQADCRRVALQAGVQDVLLKPLDDRLLLARVRSLIRAHNAAAEWQMRDDTSRALGMAEPAADFIQPDHVVLITGDRRAASVWARQLRPGLGCRFSVEQPEAALSQRQPVGVTKSFVLVIPPDPAEASAALQLIPALRAHAGTRHAGVLVIQPRPDPGLGASALDLGADDLMTDGFDATELTLRLKALMRRKRMAEQMRATVRTGLRAAVFDPLTGLHNRRYAMPHLTRIAEHAESTGRAFAVMVADLDHFKQINDIHGHAAGDAVLVETARRLRGNLRAMDLVARIGGEEFLLVMPATSLADAQAAALRLCNDIGSRPFDIPGCGAPIEVTISIGMAIGGTRPAGQTPEPRLGEALMKAADKALYSAKLHGRNQVTLSRPAA
ncbi:diguanylate cyclase [Sulfitobacter aestuarii]|uniref:diguanylate cyclase n=1 Tax=Sulfitobacter aestuarii TaxID=2161676 RepID=A0ABW5TZ92_9RHOB